MLPQISKASAAMLAMFSFGFAAIRAEDIPKGIMPNKRQAQGTGVTSSTSEATTTPPTTTDNPTTTPPTTSDPPTTSSQPPTTSAQPPTTSSQPPTTSQPPTSSDPPSSTTSSSSSVSIPITSSNHDGSSTTEHISSSSLKPTSSSNDIVSSETGKSSNLVVVGGSSTINRHTLTSATVITSAVVHSHTTRSTYTSYWTLNGAAHSSVIATDEVVASTSTSVATIEPNLANGGGNGSNLSTHSKNIIGGVVGGVGGAALVGGIALVAWRLWGKKKRQAAEHDDYLDSHDSIRHEKTPSNGTPFSTGHLDRYQNPNGTVNTASNF